MNTNKLHTDAITILKELISIPSFSAAEGDAADFISDSLQKFGCDTCRKNNNVWAKYILDDKLPTLLLNSHLDTIEPVEGWTVDPFNPLVVNGKLFGLGSNDAGASLVSLMAVFVYFSRLRNLPFNLVFAATAEEEISGDKGVKSILDDLGDIKLGIIGEPTGMRMAVAEKGLLVLDCTAKGKSSHAALEGGENAIYKALEDIKRIRNHPFKKKSDLLGEVTVKVTQIRGGYKHNIVPDKCDFVIDIRTNECYRNDEIYRGIKNQVSGDVIPRSMGLNASFISTNHPVVQKGLSMGIGYYGSATLSDQVHMQFPTVKIGPGDSERSHTADEYIMITEIHQAIDTYIRLLTGLTI